MTIEQVLDFLKNMLSSLQYTGYHSFLTQRSCLGALDYFPDWFNRKKPKDVL